MRFKEGLALKGKRYVERCLWDYKANIGKLAQLKSELADVSSVRGHSYEVHVPSSGSTDPVADVVNKVLAIERRIRRTENDIEPVRRLEADIAAGCYRDRYVREIFKLRYIEHWSVDYIMGELSVSSSTYWRGKERLIETARKYFALD